MSILRLSVDLAIPESTNGTRILANDEGAGGIVLPNAVITKLQNIRVLLRDFKQYARKINSGSDNEEASIKAEFFICHHDDPDHLLPDEPRQEV